MYQNISNFPFSYHSWPHILIKSKDYAAYLEFWDLNVNLVSSYMLNVNIGLLLLINVSNIQQENKKVFLVLYWIYKSYIGKL